MKKHILKLALLALAGLAFTTPNAKAALTYVPGDLYLNFRQVGNTTADFSLNIGNASFFRDATLPQTLTFTNLDSLLQTTFGLNWRTDSNVLWGVVGTNQNVLNTDPIRTLYVGKPAVSSDPFDSIPPPNGPNAVSANNIVSMLSYYTGNQNSESIVLGGVVGSPGNANSWTTRVANSLSNAPLGILETEVTNAIGLDLFRTPTTASGQPVTFEGRFNLGAGDTITFSPTVVPEPSTYALLAIGGVALFGLRRLRSTQKDVS